MVLWEMDKGVVAAGFGGVRAPRPTHGFDVGCRAASPLAAVAVCGGGKYPGGMNPSPTDEPLTAV